MKNSKEKTKERQGSLKEKFSFYIISAFFTLFILCVVGLMIFTHRLLYESDYFFVKGCQIEWLNKPLEHKSYRGLLDTGVGQNILKFDISSAAADILATYPELKNMQIIRDFPDRLTFMIEPRVPLAQVGENTFFLIDKEGVVLTEPLDSIQEGLPIVKGIGWRLFRKVGQRETSPRMARVLSLFEIIDEYGFTDNHTLTSIDASDYKNISFIIEDGLEIKIGHSNFRERLRALDRVLVSITEAKDQIKYVDLRFDDVVLGTK